jgi:hypothetical protein
VIEDEPSGYVQRRRESRDAQRPTIGIDQVVVRVDGNVAVVSARSFTRPEKVNRYVDMYARRQNGWVCIHACVWPLPLAVGGPASPPPD